MCARFPGSDLPAVTPFPADPRIYFFSSWSMDLGHSTSPNIALKILPFLQITQSNIVQNPSLPVFWATPWEPKSFPSCVLGEAKKVLGEICGKGKQKMDAQNRPKIVKFQHKFLPFLRFVKNETAPGSPLSGPAAFFGSIFLIYVGFGGHVGRLFPPILINGRRNNPQK